jgi:hypothetical protein
MKILLQIPVGVAPAELIERLNRLEETLAIDITLRKR